MSRFFSIFLYFTAFAISYGQTVETLKEGFADTPEEAAPETWWHWTKTFVTKEGITADLEAMKEIGLGGAHIFVLGYKDYPGEWPDVMSDEWRGLFKYAASEAKRLNLKLGIHNCPGWTTAGGPWIEPENAMQMLVASRIVVDGPRAGPFELPQPETRFGFYRDIAVLAFPSPETMPLPKITADFPIENADILIDGDEGVFAVFPNRDASSRATLVYEFDKPFEARTLEFVSDNPTIFVNIDISVSDDGVNYKTVKNYSRIGAEERPGAKIISFDPAKGKFYKFDFSNRPMPGGLPWWIGPSDLRVSELVLRNDSMISDINDKNSSSVHFKYEPPAENFASIKGIKADEILDLTGRLGADGLLDWSAPKGAWTVMRIGYTVTGAKNAPSSLSGFECDKLSRRGLDAHWPNMIAKLMSDDSAIGALKYVTVDSYEAGPQNWTKGLDAEFKKRRGYEMKNWFPAIFGYVVEDGGKSLRFLYDFQRTVSDLFAENFYDYFAELCKKNGLISITEAYGGPYDYLRCARNADIPTDEFWIELPGLPTRMPASSAHFNGKKRVGAEAFTAQPEPSRWQQDPRDLKRWGDAAWQRGISFFIFHSFVQQPHVNVKPGFLLNTEGYGSQLNRNNTWWKYGSAWVDYIKRSQYMLQQGVPSADVLILAGESNPNNYAMRDYLNIAGYDYDYCSVDDLWNNLDVKNGKIVSSGGTEYSILFLGDDRYLSLKTLKSVERLLRKGAKIAGARPSGTPSLVGDEAAFEKTAERIWGKSRAGGNQIIDSADIIEALRIADIEPDFEAPEGIGVVHRKYGDNDIYFMSNLSDVQKDVHASFRNGAGKYPTQWHADNGAVENIGVWSVDADGRMFMPLSFAPRESFFVVLSPGGAAHFADAEELETVKPAVEIVSAVYRAKGESGGADVTGALKANPELTVANGPLGGDPALGKQKELFVEYKIDGNLHSEIFEEGESLRLGHSKWGVEPRITPISDGENLFVRFGKNGGIRVKMPDGTEKNIEYGSLPEPVDMSSDWNLKFPKGQGVPEDAHMDKLVSWTDFGGGELKYFSGTADYSKNFKLAENLLKNNRRVVLDLGEVRNIAEITVNGKKVETLWKIPFAVDITDYLRAGDNNISIAVTNLWVNRLIGDAAHPTAGEKWPAWVLEDKPDSGDGRYTFASHAGWNKNDTPPKSGIIGPVLLRFADYQAIE